MSPCVLRYVGIVLLKPVYDGKVCRKYGGKIGGFCGRGSFRFGSNRRKRLWGWLLGIV